MPNSSRMAFFRTGLPMVQKSPALNITHWGLDLCLSTSAHGRQTTAPTEEAAPIWQFARRPGPLWGTNLPLLDNPHPMPPVVAPQAVWNAWQDKQTIYIVNRDGTGLRQLVDEAGPEAISPELSPNGEEVLYTQKLTGSAKFLS